MTGPNSTSPDDHGPAAPSPAGATDQAPAKPPNGITPRAALLLSLVVLPGLGQIMTGHKIRGVIMAGLLALWLPAAIIKVGLDINKVMPELITMADQGQKLSLAAFQDIMSPLAGGLIWLFLPLAAVWIWALIDSLVYARRCKKDG